MSETKICQQCGSAFAKPPSDGRPAWARRKFCSLSCKSESQRGKPTWNKGIASPRPTTFLPCRICGGPTKYSGTSKQKLYGMVHCGRSECAEASRILKNERIGAKQRADFASGRRQARKGGWANVARVSREETALESWFESIGWVPQYRFLTGVHTNKLPRQFHLDFAMVDRKLYVEVDGSVHRHRAYRERDERRDAMMSERGWTGFRIPAKVVRDDIDAAKRMILDWIESH